MSLVGASTPCLDALVERERELAVLAAAFDEASEGRGRVALVTAEAGGGKTALIGRFCFDRAGQARLLRGACDALVTPRPLGPIHDFAADSGPELTEALRGEAVPYQVAAALIDELRGREPTVLVIEDVHWADEATLDVLRLLPRRIVGERVLIVLSYREEALDATHPVRVMLGEAGLDAIRLPLAPLSADGVAQLAEPSGADANELHRATGGNPFFVTEVLASGNGAIPSTVRDAVLARAARLSSEARALLDAVAIAPSSVELWLLEVLAEGQVDALGECLTSGMLVERTRAVEFRHELARLAIEESLSPPQRLTLHRKALAALAEPPGSEPDASRLAHHAEAAGDAKAVIEFAPVAGERASAVGAHREAEAQYARALRFADALPDAERADLLERFAAEGYYTTMREGAVVALEEALAIHRERGDLLRQGEAQRLISRLLVCIGRTAEARVAAGDAVAVLEQLPPGRELARAYSAQAHVSMMASETHETCDSGSRAIELAERVGDMDALVNALNNVGVVEAEGGIPGGWEKLDRSLELAKQHGMAADAGRAYINLAEVAVVRNDWRRADCYIGEGIAYCRETGLEAWAQCLVGIRAELELAQGTWTAAAETAEAILDSPPSEIVAPRLNALVVLALVRMRRGDPEYWPLLDEALATVESIGDLQVVMPVAAARAEALWLEGKPGAIGAATQFAYELALRLDSPPFLGVLACWRRRAGLVEEASQTADPHRLLLAGNWREAAEWWTQAGYPYEAALALAEADEEEPLRESLAELQRLGARAAAAIVTRRLRELGARDIRRGPRPSTRSNAAGLTTREREILALAAEGLRNGEIAKRLFLSQRTIDNHMSAILRKLGADNRVEAAAKATTLGLVQR